MQVDEAGSDDEPAGVELLISAAANFAGWHDFSHAAVAQQDVHRCIDLRRRINQVAAFDEEALVCLAAHVPTSAGSHLSS